VNRARVWPARAPRYKTARGDTKRQTGAPDVAADAHPRRYQARGCRCSVATVQAKSTAQLATLIALLGLGLTGCPGGEADGETGNTETETGDGDGDTGDGDGDGDTGDGDGDGEPGDGDGDLGFCGDGAVGAGEECDDGNAVETDACTNACLDALCGDGLTYADVEGCDDGNSVDTDACTNACTAAACGDGVIQDAVDECDDGNQVDTDDCTNTCSIATCGDAIVQAGIEACDDGNTRLPSATLSPLPGSPSRCSAGTRTLQRCTLPIGCGAVASIGVTRRSSLLLGSQNGPKRGLPSRVGSASRANTT
jgi:cysteine-rich repeat protein